MDADRTGPARRSASVYTRKNRPLSFAANRNSALDGNSAHLHELGFAVFEICSSHLKLVVLTWVASRVVSVLDSGTEGPGFKSQSRRCRLTVLGKLFTPIVPLFTKQQNW